MLGTQESRYRWLGKVMEGSMNRASREAGNILCLDLIDGYIDVFNMLEFRALCIYDLCTFLYISYTLIRLKTLILLFYGYILYKIIRRHNFSS